MTEQFLLDSERELELEALDRGIKRYREYREKNAGNGRPEQMLAGKALDAIAAELTELQRQIAQQDVTAARGLKYWGPVVLYFPPEMLAACAVVTTIHTLVRRHKLKRQAIRQDVVRDIGENVETMFHLLKAREMDRDLYRILTKSIKHWDAKRARRFYKKVTGLNRAWTTAQRCHVGGLLYALVRTTGWFVEFQQAKGVQVNIDPEVLAELERAHEQMELLAPFQYPMVVPPADWGPGGKKGGYIYHEYSIFKPVNVGDKPPDLNDAPAVYQAINTLQRTGFQINHKVAKIQDTVWQAGGGWAGVPLKNPIITKTTGPRATDESDILATKKQRAKLWDKEAEEISPRLAMLYRRSVVERMQKFPAFYYVYQMDWRGRLYPIATSLSPQGEDLDKGLLTFAEAIPQTDEGTWWVKVHAANCWATGSIDKGSFDERVQWVDDNWENITRTANDPLAFKWWVPVYDDDGNQIAGAEDPWQFLAACYELCRTDGLTQLPVSMDGSCNGLQHYSAIGLDPIGGAAVNLVLGSRPADIYTLVAAEVRSALEQCTERPHLPPITRKLVKRAVMTLPYGLTPIGMRDQFINDKHLKACPDPYASATFLRDLVWIAIEKVVVKAMQYMVWLKTVADLSNKSGKALQWTAPTGMVVTQDYVMPDESVLNLPGLSNTVFRVIPDTVRKLHKAKQSSGVCPNTIHTFDAAHLMLTTNDARSKGVTAFLPVHDSYGTHAPRVPILRLSTAEQFIKMYEEDPFVRFKHDTEQRLGITLPDLPDRGGLDLSGIRSTRSYFFG